MLNVSINDILVNTNFIILFKNVTVQKSFNISVLCTFILKSVQL
jgi:hypothetical protein